MRHRVMALRRGGRFRGVSVLAQQPSPAQPPPAGRGQGAQAGAAARQRGHASNVPARTSGMHIYIRALKSHGDGMHDYPQFLPTGAVSDDELTAVDGSLHAPTAAELEKTDVVVFYKGDAGYMTDRWCKADLEAFVKRGGGIVSFHDSLCGPDPGDALSLVGGGKKHGETNFTLEADILHGRRQGELRS